MLPKPQPNNEALKTEWVPVLRRPLDVQLIIVQDTKTESSVDRTYRISLNSQLQLILLATHKPSTTPALFLFFSIYT